MLATLMIHRADHFTLTHSQDSSGGMYPIPDLVNNQTLAGVTPTTPNIPCNFQPEMSDVADEKRKRKEIKQATLYLVNPATYAAIGTKDVIRFDGWLYHVAGKQDFIHQMRVYALSLVQVQSGNAAS
jgi:hypothetical protein